MTGELGSLRCFQRISDSQECSCPPCAAFCAWSLTAPQLPSLRCWTLKSLTRPSPRGAGARSAVVHSWLAQNHALAQRPLCITSREIQTSDPRQHVRLSLQRPAALVALTQIY